MEQINLNLIPNGINPICHCSQYDDGRVIRVNLFDGSVPYEIANGDTITLNVRKPDNTIVTTSLTASEENSYVDIVTSQQMCACAGNNLCDLTITNGSVVIGTLNFIMAIERDVLADGVESQSVIKDLDAQVTQIAQDVIDGQLDNKVDIDGYKQVNELNTTFFTRGENIYNIDDTTDGVLLNQASDGVHDDAAFTTSGFIYVANLTSIKFMRLNAAGTAFIQDSAYYQLFDNEKNRIGNRQIGTSVNISTAVWLRVSNSMQYKSTFMIVDSSLTVSKYIPFKYKFNYSDDEVVIYPTDNILQKLVANKGKNIYFEEGNYNVIDIYKAYYGNDFFDNYVNYSGNVLYRGLPVYQNTKMRFSPNARFTCIYGGNNSNVRQNFSAFAFEGGVTFDGLNIIASGIRNVIHDDFDNNFVGNTIIKNCHIVHDYIILAGGLAFHENVEIFNNYFERTDITTHVFDISYHNNGTSGAQSNLIIKDNYFSKGISIRYYGSSTLISDCLISNNSMANEIEYRAENETATIENVRVLKWNNLIRT